MWDKLNIRDIDPADSYPGYPDFAFSYYTVNPSKGEKLLYVGDSFAPALRFDLARHFGEVLTVNFFQARKNAGLNDWFRCVFDEIKPGYIVFGYHNDFIVFKEFVDNFYALKETGQPPPARGS